MRRWQVTLLGLVALCCLVAAGSAVTAQETVTVEAGDEQVDAGDSTLVPIRLSAVPDGLSGYELTASVSGDSGFSVTGGEYARAFGLTTEPDVSGNTVTLEAVDTENRITSGDGSVLLGYVAVESSAQGEAAVDVSVTNMHDDSGSDIPVTTATGTVVARDSGGGGGSDSGGGSGSDSGSGGGGVSDAGGNSDDSSGSSDDSSRSSDDATGGSGDAGGDGSDSAGSDYAGSTDSVAGTDGSKTTTTPAGPRPTEADIRTAKGVITPQSPTETPTGTSTVTPPTPRASQAGFGLPVVPLGVAGTVLGVLLLFRHRSRHE